MGTKVQLPRNFVLTAHLTSGITLVSSLIYLLLCIVSLLFQLQCDEGLGDINGSGFFINTLYRVYFQSETCEYAISWDGITSPSSTLILVAMTLVTSICGAAAASTLISVVTSDKYSQYINPATYVYVGVFVITLIVDCTFATHFGIDQSNLASQLDGSSAGVSLNYVRDILRLGSLLLMIVALKGIVVHLVNIVLVVMLVVFLADHNDKSKKGHHPIHKLGALNAFEQHNKKPGDSWPSQSEGRGLQTNHGFTDSELPPTLERNLSLYNRGSYERSNSWLPVQTSMSANRPFSYLEDVRRPISVRSPTVDQQWREWPPSPPVPAPDYSPHNNRKLKPALKLNYTNNM